MQRVVVTGIDIGIGDLVALLVKVTLAWIPVAFVAGLCWYALSLSCGLRR